MKDVSAAFIAAMKKPQHIEHLRGTISSVSFEDRNIISFNYSNACSESKDVTFGSARIGQIQATFVNVNIPVFTWRGRVINLQYGLEIDDEHTTEWIDVGRFTIAKADWTDTGMNVTAYDDMANLDKPFGITSTNGTIHDLLELVERETGVQNGMTFAACEALPNGSESLGLYPQNDIKTWRDFVSWLGVTIGGFATIDENGGLILKSFFNSTVVDSFESRKRIVGSVFSDYVTEYAGVSIQDAESGRTMYYDVDGATGLYISLGSNPLLQYGLEGTKNRQRGALAEAAHSIAYSPFNIAILNCPVYDLGDLVECSGGVAGESTLTCCVMAINWTFKNTLQMQGFGADPNLTAGQTKTDRALNNMASKQSENEVITYTFVNAATLELGEDDEETIVDILFATIKPRTVLLWHSINLDLTITDPSGVATATAYFYLNEELVGYSPVETWNEDGKHILPLLYFIDTLTAGTAYEWRVALVIHGGTAEIDVGYARAMLQGQGLVAIDEFNGTIKCKDTDYTTLVYGQDLVTLVDDPAPVITTVGDIGYMVTENGDPLITEDGSNFITE